MFVEKLAQIQDNNNSLLCVGLDPDLNLLPSTFRNNSYPLFNFNKEIIDSTITEVCAFKPQIAYYSAYGKEKDLELTIEYIRKKNSSVQIILDAKRGDIGSTSELYAKELFERYNVDAATVNPFIGLDALEAYLKYKDRGIIILCKTSNQGSSFIQNLEIDGKPIYEMIAQSSLSLLDFNSNICLVVGATYPLELQKIRKLVGEMPFLVPGVGHQGADVDEIIKNGLNSTNKGLIISSSRAIIYAGLNNNLQEGAFKFANTLKNQINKMRI